MKASQYKKIREKISEHLYNKRKIVKPVSCYYCGNIAHEASSDGWYNFKAKNSEEQIEFRPPNGESLCLDCIKECQEIVDGEIDNLLENKAS